MPGFRVLFVSDLHGSEVGFRKFLNAVPVYKPDLLIYGGDLMGKVLQPVFRTGPGRFRWFPTPERPADLPEAELPAVERKIADQGRYVLVTTADEWEALRRTPERLEARCRELGLERVRAWLGLVRERLTPSKLPVVMNVGNDDVDGVLDVLRHEAPPNVLVPEGQVVRAGPYEVFGCGYANMTPWRCPRDLEEAELGRFLDRTSGQIGNPRRTILDLHAPPYGTAIDLAPELDRDLRPRTASGQMLFTHVGSPSIRRLLETVRPVVGLHGHIHESMGFDRVGGVPVFNPGSTYFSGTLQGLVLTLDGERVAGHAFITG